MGRGVARRVRIKDLLAGARVGDPVEVTGWVKTSRFSKNVSFVHVFDGSSTASLQVVLEPALAERHAAELGLGAAVRITGRWQDSPGGEQAMEVLAAQVEIVGPSDPATYPIQKKRTTLEHLRTIGQFRPRTNTFQSVFRVRNAVSDEIHRFFQSRGFLWIHTPILTASDAEGAGELFQVEYDARAGGRGSEDVVLRQAGLPHGVGAARGRSVRRGLHGRVHVRSDVPRGELQHGAPRCGVLDGRARDCVRAISTTCSRSARSSSAR